MFSLVIPTLWRSKRIFTLIDKALNHPLITDLILIDNNQQYYNYFDSVPEKLNLIIPKENLYVNPSWNLGVNKAQSNYIGLCNDDIDFDFVLFELLTSQPDLLSDKIVGMHSQNYHINSIDEIKLVPTGGIRNWGWGCLILFDKKNWINIPEDIKVWYGDDFIFNNNPVHCYNLEGFPILTEMSTTSDSNEFNNVKQQDLINYNKWKNSH